MGRWISLHRVPRRTESVLANVAERFLKLEPDVSKVGELCECRFIFL
jgi:hypothetical protein